MNRATIGPSVLHVIVRAGATNSQYNEHCLPVLAQRRITVCSLFPADVTPPSGLRLVEGSGKRGSMRTVRRALDLGPYDVVHVHSPSSGVLTLAAYLLTRRSRRNLVFTVHNSWDNFRRRNRAFLYLILLLYPTVVMCGHAARDSLPWLLRRAFRRKLEVVPNGVDVDRIDRVLEALPVPETPANGPVVASVNRLIPLKDPSTVLRAFERAELPHGDLVFVGDGPLRDRLQTDVLHSMVHDRVTVTGIIPRDQVYGVLSTADVFVSASGGEGLPVAVLEAMACECPVILSDIPPHREIAVAAPGVQLVPVGDVAGFARALWRVLYMPTADRHELGWDQRQCVSEYFSVRAMNNAYGEIYMTVMERNETVQLPPRVVAGSGGVESVGLVARMRDRIRLVAVLTIIGGLGGMAYSQVQPPEYHATTNLLVGDVIGGPADEEGLKAAAALAATYSDLVRREPVLKPVAEEGFADDWRTLRLQVHAQPGDNNPQLVQITTSAPKMHEAEGLAGAVADQLVALTKQRQLSAQDEFAVEQVDRLEKDITATQDQIRKAQKKVDQASTPEEAAEFATAANRLRETLTEMQTNYDEMRDQVRRTGGSARVAILEEAYASPSALRPDLKGLVAAGAGTGLALAVAWIYLSDRRRARLARSQHRVTGPLNGHDRRNGQQPGSWAGHDMLDDIHPIRHENKGI
ncbi:MAG: glycosyltransferase [Nocardioidaceae bacterium]